MLLELKDINKSYFQEMTMVHTIWEELKYGANSLLAPSSTAMTDIPAKNSVRYKNSLFFKIPE